MTSSNPFLTLLMLPTSTASGDSRKLTASSVQCFLGSVFLLTHPVVAGCYFGGFEGQFHTHPIYPFHCFVTPGHVLSPPGSHQRQRYSPFGLSFQTPSSAPSLSPSLVTGRTMISYSSKMRLCLIHSPRFLTPPFCWRFQLPVHAELLI